MCKTGLVKNSEKGRRFRHIGLTTIIVLNNIVALIFRFPQIKTSNSFHDISQILIIVYLELFFPSYINKMSLPGRVYLRKARTEVRMHLEDYVFCIPCKSIISFVF